MKVHRDTSEIYPAHVPACGRCWICGAVFDFGRVEFTAEIGETDGDICQSCAELAETDRGELRRRMLIYSRILRGMADELAARAEEVA